MQEKKVQRNFEEEIRKGNAPGFSVPLILKRAKAGDTVILECVPYGKPFPEIKWLKDGFEIETNDKITVTSNYFFSLKLKIKIKMKINITSLIQLSLIISKLLEFF